MGVSLVFALIASCEAGSDGTSSSSSSSTGGAGGGTSNGGAGGTGGVDLTGVGGGGNCALTCSADLHHVIDCTGTIVSTCPSDQGCGPDLTCIPACDAADAAKATIGCEYYAQRASAGRCYAVFIANTWDSEVTISVEVGGVPVDASPFSRITSGNGQSIVYSPLPGGALPEGEVAIVFLDGNTCPGGVTPPGLQPKSAFHIETSRPVVAYAIDPYGGGDSAVTSASLLIPTSAWDLNYIAVNAWPFGPNSTNPRLTVTAAEDATSVTINPLYDVTAAFIDGAAAATTLANTPVTYTLNRGQTLRIEQEQELTGSPILADKPIGVFGSASCFNIDACCCDSTHEQLPPVQAWGSQYAAVRYRSRIDGDDESVPWRFVGAVDGTQLTYEPAAPAGAPTTLDQGQVAEFRSPGPFIVTSQDEDHPFYVATYMTGAGDFQNIGDPEWVNVIPLLQYRSGYIFFTDPTYPETNLVVVRTRASDGEFKDVILDCAGALTGWQAIDGAGDVEYTRTDLVRGNFEQQGACDNGRREMSSEAPFGLTVWGWGTEATQPAFTSTYVSYAYPAGASVQQINEVVVIPTPE